MSKYIISILIILIILVTTNCCNNSAKSDDDTYEGKPCLILYSNGTDMDTIHAIDYELNRVDWVGSYAYYRTRHKGRLNYISGSFIIINK